MLRRSSTRRPARNSMPRASPRERVAKRTTPLEATRLLRQFIIESSENSQTTSDAETTSTKAEKHFHTLGRQISGPKTVKRPKFTHKAASAPSDADNGLHTKPRPPRRAISARTVVPTERLEDQRRRHSLEEPVLPLISQLANPVSRSLISRRKSSRKSVGRLGLKPNRGVWRQLNLPTLERLKIVSGASESSAFANETWLRKSLKKEDIGGLRTNIVEFETRQFPDTPTSMTDTPREFYRRPGKVSRKPTVKRSAQAGRRLPLQSVSANTAKHPTKQQFLRLTDAPPLESEACAHHVYVPGPILLNQTPVYVAASRKASIATLEPFVGEVECTAPFRRHSDQAALDGIVAYFQNFGVVEEAHDDGLDQFWQHDPDSIMEFRSMTPPAPPASPSAKAFKTLGLDGNSHSPTRGHTRSSSSLGSSLFMPWIKPWQQQDPQRSPSPRPAQPPSPRQRINFKRLLNSATASLYDSN